jgi:hypothetical protein
MEKLIPLSGKLLEFGGYSLGSHSKARDAHNLLQVNGLL